MDREAAIDESVPAPVISASLWQRYESRAEGDFAARVLSAMRSQFGVTWKSPREPMSHSIVVMGVSGSGKTPWAKVSRIRSAHSSSIGLAPFTRQSRDDGGR